jgi:predicted molibdopterin-dependent oxidoreductase YjgC
MTTNEIHLWIDDRKVKAKAGQTILETANQLGISIPSLCYHPVLKPSGSCRLCAVEIDGQRGLPAACTTPVTEGMRIRTSTQKVQDFRREMLRMLLQEHPRDCQGCPKNGVCELQNLVSLVGIDFPYAPPEKERPPALPGGAYFERDYSLCVHCGRCVRVCHEVRGAKAIVFREVNGRQEVSTPFDAALDKAGCQFCGACVDVCPVGALRENMDAFKSEPRASVQDVCGALADIVMGLYARETPRQWTSAVCPICTAGCRLMVEKNEAGEIVQVRPAAEGPNSNGQACVQGRFLLKRYINSSKRLTQPLVKENGALVEKGWKDALDVVASKLKSYGPGETAVLTDGRATNEELYLLQKFARTALQTNAVGCLVPKGHEESAKAFKEELGVMAATNSFEDIAQADAILALGFNPAASHPIAGTRIREAVLNGAKLIVVNPCAVSIARYADVHLANVPDTELPLILGLLRVIIDEKGVDPAFAKKYAKDLTELRGAVNDFDLGKVADITGTSQENLVDAACILGESKKIAIVYGLGLLESPQASEAVRALAALSFVKGSLGQSGGGLAPFYGAANLQGAWDMGMVCDLLPGQVSLSDKKERKRIAGAWKSDLSAPETTDIYKDMADGKIKALYLAMERLDGESLDRLRPYLDKLEFVVVQDLSAPPAGIKADVVLPMASMLEKEGTITNSERRVQWIQPVLTPPENAKSVQWVTTELAKRMDAPGFTQEGIDGALAEIAKIVPSYGGISAKRLQMNALQWPCLNTKHAGTPVLFTDKKITWKKWKPEISKTVELQKNEEFPFTLIPMERLESFYSGPLTAPEAAAAMKPKGDIVLNPVDGFGMELREGQEVRLMHCLGQESGKVSFSFLVPPKTIVVPSGMCRKSFGGLDLKIRISFAKVERI